MIFYLAARYSRRLELCGYRSDLEERDHKVPARWLLGEHQVHGVEAAAAIEADGEVPAAQARLFADDDMLDLLQSDAVVFFTESPRVAGGTRGGRHVEFGVALGQRYTGHSKQKLFVVGPTENVFYALPHVHGHFRRWSDFLERLDAGDI